MKEINITDLFFLEIIITFLIIGLFFLKIYLLKNYTLAQNKTFQSLNKKETPYFYSTYFSKKIEFNKLFRIKNPNYINLYISSLKNINKTSQQILKQLKCSPNDYKLLLLYANLTFLLNDRISFQHTLSKIKLPIFAPILLKANYLYLKSHNDLYNTDMYSASKNCSKSLKIYQNNKASYEIALCYLTLAQTYRISGVYDVAFSMLKEAKKIFEKLSLHQKYSEVIAYFGLTELGRENFDVANQYFNQALETSKKYKLNKTSSDINNWLGLSLYSKNDIKQAKSIFQNITKSDYSSLLSLGFAYEMLTRIALKNKNYKSALKYVNCALNNYSKTSQSAGIFENLYLKADIYYKTFEYSKSKEILISLIKQKTSFSTTYYIANAYTLLGLIYLNENNLNLAKTTFKQALDLENSRNRLKGALIDYNNLAETSFRLGDEKQAKEYLNLALSCSQKIEDKELEDYIKSKLKD